MPTNVGFHHLKVGDIAVTALNDGQFQAPAEWIIGTSADDLQHLLERNFRPFPPRITLNAFLLEVGGRKILLDAGAGGKFGPTMGAVGRHLKTLGVDPAEIRTILLTHAHTDHVGGLTDDAGAAAFPNAELLVNGIEHDFWMKTTPIPAGAEDGFKAARAAFEAYASRTRRIGDGEDVAPGVKARILPGHTPGHTGFHIGSGGDQLLIWGDIVHLPGAQFEQPGIGMMFDTDPDLARTTRAAIFAEVAQSRIIIAGMHLDFPTFAHLRQHAGQYEVEPIVWAPEA